MHGKFKQRRCQRKTNEDVITSPPSKHAKIFTENSSHEWVCNYSEKGDAVIINESGNRTVKIFEKKRPDDLQMN